VYDVVVVTVLAPAETVPRCAIVCLTCSLRSPFSALPVPLAQVRRRVQAAQLARASRRMPCGPLTLAPAETVPRWVILGHGRADRVR